MVHRRPRHFYFLMLICVLIGIRILSLRTVEKDEESATDIRYDQVLYSDLEAAQAV